jgi:hypothetical protein
VIGERDGSIVYKLFNSRRLDLGCLATDNFIDPESNALMPLAQRLVNPPIVDAIPFSRASFRKLLNHFCKNKQIFNTTKYLALRQNFNNLNLLSKIFDLVFYIL